MSRPGFTLAELLLALVILGVIATFTIPKVITSQQNGKLRSIAKEAAGSVSGAFQSAQLNGKISSASNFWAMTPYLNYVVIDSTSGTAVTDPPGSSNFRTCSAAWPCLRMHNGANIITGDTFAGTAATNMIWFWADADGSGSGQSVAFALYYNGKITTWPNLLPNSTSSFGVYSAGGSDPSWFAWD